MEGLMETVNLQLPDRTDTRLDEAMKTLRTNIQFSGSNLKVIMLTSTVPSEGKSTTSWRTAMAFAQMGKKTLYIDADIRKSVFAKRMQPDKETFGLSQYLSGQRSLVEIVYHTNAANLDVVFAGPYAPNPTELFEEKAFADLIQYGRDNYDMTIIDTAPLGSVIDAAIIAPQTDGAIMVVESGNIGYKMLNKTKFQLQKTGVKVLGIVLNKVPMQKGSYYGSYYYGKYYGKYDNYYK